MLVLDAHKFFLALGAHAAHRLVARRTRWRGAPECFSASRKLKERGSLKKHLTVSASFAPWRAVRGGRVPAKTRALMPPCRMGSPPGSFVGTSRKQGLRCTTGGIGSSNP